MLLLFLFLTSAADCIWRKRQQKKLPARLQKTISSCQNHGTIKLYKTGRKKEVWFKKYILQFRRIWCFHWTCFKCFQIFQCRSISVPYKSADNFFRWIRTLLITSFYENQILIDFCVKFEKNLEALIIFQEYILTLDIYNFLPKSLLVICQHVACHLKCLSFSDWK